MRKAVGFVVVGVLAACGPAAVESERADVASGPAPTVEGSPTMPPNTAPVPTSPPLVEVPDTGLPEIPTDAEAPAEPPISDAPPAPEDPSSQEGDDESSGDGDDGRDDVELRDPELGVGDGLFPELGSSDIDVVSYGVGLDIDPTADVIDGSIEIVLEASPDIGVLPLDQIDLDVGAVTVDGESADFELTETELLVTLPPGSERTADGGGAADAAPVPYVVGVDYSFRPDGAISDLALPSGWFANRSTGNSYVLNQPDGARLWMPSNDHPSDKATWTFEIDVPEGVVAVANGELVGRPTGGLERPWSWREDEPMSTYLVQLIVGDYEVVVTDPLTSAAGDEIAITHVVPAGEREVFDDAFDTVAEQVTFFEDLFGPYPLERYGLAFVVGLRNVAMETQGRSMFGAADFPDGVLGFIQQLLLAHEIAHQWFGNAVTPADWSDIWLSESFTTYAQWLWLDEIGLQPLEIFAEVTLDQRQTDNGSTGDPAIGDMFGFNSYDGGAVVVHALRRTIGDEAFFELLNRWVTEFWGTAQTTETLIELAEEVHGDDLTTFFDDWLFASDLPDEYP